MSTTDAITVLLIEDNLAEARLLQEILYIQHSVGREGKRKSFHLIHVKRLGAALQRLRQQNFDVILLDLTLPDSQGLASVQTLNRTCPNLPVVVLTNTNDDELALEAVRQGAQDYLMKRHVNAETLGRSLCYAIERKQVSEALWALNQALEIRVQERTAELMQAQELNQRQAELVSMFSHDFRSPLNTILLSAGLLQTHEDKLTDEKKLTHFQLIRSAISDMAQLLDEVLLMGRADCGKLQCQFEPLDLESICRNLVAEVQLGAGPAYQIQFQSQGDFSHSLWDGNLIRHILWNLLTNAVKYSPQGGRVEFSLSRRQDTAQFQIQDWGIGIPPTDQLRLFQPFQRASNTGAIAGTGLGLAIAKKCVEAQGGEIKLQSQVNLGTTLTVILPLILGC